MGEAAKSQAARNPKNTLYDIKRILGQKMGEHAVKDEVKRFPFEIVADKETDDPRIACDERPGELAKMRVADVCFNALFITVPQREIRKGGSPTNHTQIMFMIILIHLHVFVESPFRILLWGTVILFHR